MAYAEAGCKTSGDVEGVDALERFEVLVEAEARKSGVCREDAVAVAVVVLMGNAEELT